MVRRRRLRSDVLVMGFARRFATYKRALMLFVDPEVVAPAQRPAPSGRHHFAGKAHPRTSPASI
jgi:starch phosphorylase